jgi:hypothetical protein
MITRDRKLGADMYSSFPEKLRCNDAEKQRVNDEVETDLDYIAGHCHFPLFF